MLYSPVFNFFTAQISAKFDISVPIIFDQFATKSESDARTPKSLNKPPNAPAIVCGRFARAENLSSWFDIAIFFRHQDIHFALGMLTVGIIICLVTFAKEYVGTNPTTNRTAGILGNHQASELLSI